MDEKKFNNLVEKMIDEIPTTVVKEVNLELRFDELFTDKLNRLEMSEFVEYDEAPDKYYEPVMLIEDKQLTGIGFVEEEYDEDSGNTLSFHLFDIDISSEALHRAEEAIKNRKENYHKEIMVNNFSEMFEKLGIVSFENIARNYFRETYGDDSKYHLKGYGYGIYETRELLNFLAELGAEITDRYTEDVIIRTKHEAYRVHYECAFREDADYILYFNRIKRVPA